MSSQIPESASLAQASQAALARQDWAAADALLRRRLDTDPNNPEILHNLGCAAYFRNDAGEAVRFLQAAVACGGGVQSNVLLGRVFEGAGRDPDALRCYKDALKIDPAQFESLLGLGNIRDRNGDPAAARSYYARAVAARPSDPEAVLKYSWALWEDDPQQAVRLTLDLLARAGDDLRLKLRALEVATVQVEMAERIARGLPPYHIKKMEEQFFTHARPLVDEFADTCRALLATHPDDDPAKIQLSFTRLSKGDRAGAEALLRSAHKATAGFLLDAVRFSPDFHERLRNVSEDELLSGLPPVVTLRPPVPDPAGVLFLSCDAGYFTSFGYPMLRSLRERSPGTPVHLHIMDGAEVDLAGINGLCGDLAPHRIGLSVENPGLTPGPKKEARCYYHAIRLVRFYQMLRLYGCPLWMADVDAIVNRDFAGLFAQLGGSDIAIRVRAGRLEPQSQFSACLIGGTSRPRSLGYLRQVAAYISSFHRENGLRWGIDQLALYSVYADLADRGAAPSLSLLGPREIDADCTADSFLWVAAGARKFGHLKRTASAASGTAPETPGTRFAAALARYSA